MDEKFLEFWGNLLINFARGKKQANDTSQMIKKNLADFNELTTSMMQKNLTSLEELFGSIMKKNLDNFNEMSGMFRNLYGLDQFSEQSTEYKTMSKKAVQDFQKSFKDYLKYMGFAPRETYVALVEKYEKLKEKCAEQEETIKHLKMLLKEKSPDYQKEMLRGLQNIVKDQTDLFRKIMKDFTSYTGKEKLTEASGLSSEPKTGQLEQITKIKGEKDDDGNNGSERMDQADD